MSSDPRDDDSAVDSPLNRRPVPPAGPRVPASPASPPPAANGPGSAPTQGGRGRSWTPAQPPPADDDPHQCQASRIRAATRASAQRQATDRGTADDDAAPRVRSDEAARIASRRSAQNRRHCSAECCAADSGADKDPSPGQTHRRPPRPGAAQTSPTSTARPAAGAPSQPPAHPSRPSLILRPPRNAD